MLCSAAWRTFTLRSTKPSARSARMPTSFFAPIGPWSPDFELPASIVTSSAFTPEPSSWRLQRMHFPRFGMPCRSCRGGCGSEPLPTLRPMTAMRFWSFGHLDWYAYDTACVEPRSFWITRFWHFGSCVFCLRDVGSVYRPGMTTTRSLLRALVTAFWISLYLQRLASALFTFSSALACFLENLRWSWGRMK